MLAEVVQQSVNGMTLMDLNELGQLMDARIVSIGEENKQKLKVGQKVKFWDEKVSQYWGGHIMKKNGKRAKLSVGGREWNVPYVFLFPEEDDDFDICSSKMFAPGDEVRALDESIGPMAFGPLSWVIQDDIYRVLVKDDEGGTYYIDKKQVLAAERAFTEKRNKT